MRILVWNVNGIRAITKKEVLNGQLFNEYLSSLNLDIICFNEMKIGRDQIESLNILNEFLYQYHATSVIKKGYSGVSIYSKVMPIKSHDFTENQEGRVLALEYDDFILVCVYQPNSGPVLARLNYKTDEWASQFKSFIQKMKRIKPVIIVGDMNVARTEMDIKNASKHTKSAGYTIQERAAFESLLSSCDLVDTWRDIHPDKTEYTYFDYRSRARSRNAGWRIDYVLANSSIYKNWKSTEIQSDVLGSDHVPLICEF